jgi:hypothetical protein
LTAPLKTFRQAQHKMSPGPVTRFGIGIGVDTIRSTRITVETETVTLVRRAILQRAWCPACGAETDVICISDQSLGDPASAVQLRQWAEMGKLHLLQSDGDPGQICLPSLLQCFERDEADWLRSWRLK